VLHGAETFDDAGVIRISDEVALVQTVDFFPPIVDDPRDYGRIAAANSLSDVYAMGGEPLSALNIVAFPRKKLALEVLGEILAGAAETMTEANTALLGGHSVDAELLFGLAVTGTVHPGKIVKNGGARPGDRLVLTKPLGMGAISTGMQREKAEEAEIRAAVESMAALNAAAAAAIRAVGVHAATDITGFGLMGHGTELAEASGVTLRLDASRLPFAIGARRLAERGILSGGSNRNRGFLGEKIAVEEGVPGDIVALAFDSETSGGLLIAVAAEKSDALVSACRERGTSCAAVIGEVLPREPGTTIRLARG